MRKSNIILLVAIGCVVFFLIIAIAATKFMVISDYKKVKPNAMVHWTGNPVVQHYDFKGFTGVKVNGQWDVVVKYSNDYTINVIVPEEESENIMVVMQGNTLHLGYTDSMLKDAHLKAEITMPQISTIDVNGAVNMILQHFTGDDLTMTLSGTGRIKGEDCTFSTLNIKSRGASDIDFKDVKVKNCNFDMSGAGNTILYMDGGELKGEIKGLEM